MTNREGQRGTEGKDGRDGEEGEREVNNKRQSLSVYVTVMTKTNTNSQPWVFVQGSLSWWQVTW